MEITGPHDGIRLRPYREADAAAIAASLNDPLTRRYPPARPEHCTEAYARDLVAEALSAAGTLAQAISDRHGELLGGIALDRAAPGRDQAEVRLWVGPWARRRGVATTALRAFSACAFGAGLARLELLAHWGDPVSQRLALTAGYTREGVRRGALPDGEGGRADAVVFARLADDSGDPAPRLLPDLPGGELTDGVVTLRPVGADDEAFYTTLQSQPDVIATRVPPEPFTPEQIRERCARAQAHWLAGTRADLVITDAATGEPAGEISLYYIEPPTGQAMIGYCMMPDYRGRGWTTRAAVLLSLWAFAETGVVRLIAGALPTNLGSQRVLEKAGFRREAYLRSRLPGPGNTRVDDVQFVRLATDLLAEAAEPEKPAEPDEK